LVSYPNFGTKYNEFKSLAKTQIDSRAHEDDWKPTHNLLNVFWTIHDERLALIVKEKIHLHPSASGPFSATDPDCAIAMKLSNQTAKAFVSQRGGVAAYNPTDVGPCLPLILRERKPAYNHKNSSTFNPEVAELQLVASCINACNWLEVLFPASVPQIFGLAVTGATASVLLVKKQNKSITVERKIRANLLEKTEFENFTKVMGWAITEQERFIGTLTFI